MADIILVGTVHSDFKGHERLARIFKFHKEPIIVIEPTVKESEIMRAEFQ